MTVVAVLAGGLGSRMGGDKPSALLGGRPLIAYPLAAARSAALEAVVVAKPATALPPLPELGRRVEILLEDQQVHHPLVGLITALQRFPRVIAIGCDMPFLSGELLAWLAARPCAPAWFSREGRTVPFPSLHTAAELPLLRTALTREASLRATFRELRAVDALRTVVLPESDLIRFGDPERLLRSIDTPEGLISHGDGVDQVL